MLVAVSIATSGGPVAMSVVSAGSIAAIVCLAFALIASRRQARTPKLQLRAAAFAATTDTLTGLATRAGLRQAMIRCTEAADPGDYLAAILFDIDDLKAINDRHGHDVGDSVPVEVARRLRGNAAGVECAARLGGDEFVVLLGPGGSATVVLRRAEYLARETCMEIRQPIPAIGRPIRLTASAGVAVASARAADSLLTDADRAIYRAKEAAAASGSMRGACGQAAGRTSHLKGTESR